ncbi:arginase, hepatic-like isoform X1 [Portunus trituberculatus]|uniref:arginase, hepatic-like isoform X1 n=1 Tax=Portunus trituberculatus TaxID=210409 RepID=UPI001E1CFFCA|nr:arginase, hepatic-like isoform X1 [Portunus trituberculatus]
MYRAALCLLAPTMGRGMQRSLSCLAAPTVNRKVGVIGAAFEKGQVRRDGRRIGVSDGPKVIRETGVLNHLAGLGLDIRDFGDVEDKNSDTKDAEIQLGPDGERHHTTVLEYNRRLAASVSEVVKEGRVCVTLGGDHSISIGTLNGHMAAVPDQQVVVLWVDAHADLNTGAISPTGNMHGMPAAHHLRGMAQQINRMADGWPHPCLDAHHIVYVGLRDVDPCERELMDQMGILSFSMREVDRVGFHNVLEAALSHLKPSPSRPLHLSFDIDALDPVEAPSTGTRVRGGLTLREGLALCEAVQETGYLSALDLVEVNPSIGTGEDAAITTNAARLLLLSALAGRRT